MHVYPETLVFFIRKDKLHFMRAENHFSSLQKENITVYYILTDDIVMETQAFRAMLL